MNKLLGIVFLWLCLAAHSALALQLSVSYDAPVRCGTPTTFTLTPSGYSGTAEECKFQLQCIRLTYKEVDPLTKASSSQSMMVFDSSRPSSPWYSYQTDNTFSFTFYASGDYQLYFYVMDLSVMPRVTARQIVNLSISDSAYPSVDTIADQIVAKYKALYSDPWDLALALNDWLVGNTVYDADLLYCSPEGVLARGKGTCESYQRAYAMLLGRAGIENDRAEGTGHTWNLAKLNSHWVHIDPTWNDSEDTHFYFGVTDQMMALTQGHAGYTPAANRVSTCPDEHYYLHTGEVTKWSDRYHSAIQAKLNAGAASFTLGAGTILNTTYEDSIRKLLCAARLSSEDWFSSFGTAHLSLQYSPDTNLFTGSVQYTDLRALNLPDRLTSVGASAFSGTGANAVRIPDSLTDEESLAALPADIVWLCPEGSAAAAYAKANGISFKTE